MKKNNFIILVFCSAILAVGINIFIGRWLSAKISTFPFFNRIHLINPQTPIVITNRETIRVSDGADILQALNTAKPRLSSIVFEKNSSMNLAGSAVNITSDGWFVTAGASFQTIGQSYYVVLQDGNTVPIKTLVPDEAIDLVFFKADIKNVPSTVFGISKDLETGEKLLLLADDPQNFDVRYISSFVTVSENNVVNVIYNSDVPGRNFGIQAEERLLSGTAVVNMKGELVGIWNGSSVIPSDILKQSVGLLLAEGNNIKRPLFGFTYKYILPAESQISGQPEGAKIVSVLKAQNTPLQENDIITAVERSSVSATNGLEIQLVKYKTGDTITMTIFRNRQEMTISFKVQ